MLLLLDVGSTAYSHTTHLDISKPLPLGVDMLGHREPMSDVADSLSQVILFFLFWGGMVKYANEVETKEK